MMMRIIKVVLRMMMMMIAVVVVEKIIMSWWSDNGLQELKRNTEPQPHFQTVVNVRLMELA